MADDILVPMPSQPRGVPWPAPDPDGWPVGSTSRARQARRRADRRRGSLRRRLRRGCRSRGAPAHRTVRRRAPAFDRPPEPVTPTTPLLSWSMAKSVLHAGIGCLVADGQLRLDEPRPVPSWHERRGRSPRHHHWSISSPCATVSTSPRTTSTLASPTSSRCCSAPGKDDVAAYAEGRSLAYTPGTRFNYSSGTSNVVATDRGALRRQRSSLRRPPPSAGVRPWEWHRPTTARRRRHVHRLVVRVRDRTNSRGSVCCISGTACGTVSGSCRRDGSTTPGGCASSTRKAELGAHWWVVDDDQGSFRASGYEGQAILVCPGLDLVAVRLGHSTAEQYPALKEWRAAVVDWAR